MQSSANSNIIIVYTDGGSFHGGGGLGWRVRRKLNFFCYRHQCADEKLLSPP